MKGNISCFSNQKTGLIRRQPNMNPKQFELFKEQIKNLSPQQLRALKGEITETLEGSRPVLVTDEEQKLISSLFS
ncbi:hypothetical protein GGC03_23375 (plasmid) [Vibrio sp. THAF191c]|nr:hypothetical protein FIU99_17070 [Vibrio sp. THAF64]QGM37386.1 hypothetical protein GGC04_24155 [Vibrio sp. THAF191d]QGN72727.1 hypothetical protein GGC03_23375 [Vibrio sp. THAF191c]